MTRFLLFILAAKLLFSNQVLKLRCDRRFQHAFTACSCVFKVIALVGSKVDILKSKQNLF
jgi:hypothetical protein